MRRALVLLPLLLAAAACDSPSPGFARAPALPVEVEGSRFTVRVQEGEAEAIRLSREWAPTLGSVAPRAVAAIERASGCRVRPGTLTGDAAVVRAALDC